MAVHSSEVDVSAPQESPPGDSGGGGGVLCREVFSTMSTIRSVF